MAIPMKPPGLWVEGTDDEHVLKHLLALHDIDCFINCKTQLRPSELPEFKVKSGVHNILEGMEKVVRSPSYKKIGFVLDADSPLQKRWEEVCYRLQNVGLSPTSNPPADGFCEYSEEYKTTVGVWLMPDNQQDGKLETFLRTLIDDADVLIGHAAASTQKATELGAEFTEPDRDKAVLHTWLAWQKEPGRPFGSAITQRFFIHKSPAADAFVTWFKRLYNIS